jgi:uncharacterized protein (TIGR00290 family)
VKTLISWSTGKDSAWMLHVLRREGAGTAAALLTSINEHAARVSMHGVREVVLRAQAEATGLPLIVVPLPYPCSNEIYEERMAAVVAQAAADGFTHIAFGDLFLEDIRRYREDRLQGTGLTPLFPLWGQPTGALAREMIAGGLRAKIACLDPRQMPRTFIGADFDRALLDALPSTVDPCGERGEFHTCVTAGPMFSREIPLELGDTVERDGFLFADLRPEPGSGGT